VIIDALQARVGRRIPRALADYGYARQDPATVTPLVPITAKLVADLLTAPHAGVDSSAGAGPPPGSIQGFLSHNLPVTICSQRAVIIDYPSAEGSARSRHRLARRRWRERARPSHRSRRPGPHRQGRREGPTPGGRHALIATCTAGRPLVIDDIIDPPDARAGGEVPLAPKGPAHSLPVAEVPPCCRVPRSTASSLALEESLYCHELHPRCRIQRIRPPDGPPVLAARVRPIRRITTMNRCLDPVRLKSAHAAQELDDVRSVGHRHSNWPKPPAPQRAVRLSRPCLLRPKPEPRHCRSASGAPSSSTSRGSHPSLHASSK